MRIRVLLQVLLIAAACFASRPANASPSRLAAPAPAAGIQRKAPVVMILMENHGYDQIIGAPDAPYLNRFSRRGTLLTDMHAITHPSLPNYLALTAGSTLGCPDNHCPRRHYASGNIFHQLQQTGRGWRSWQESMPGHCALTSNNPYAVRHNPAPYFTNLFPKGCPQWDVPYPKVLPKQLRAFTFITPNLINDMHDGTVAQGDAWLASHVPPLLARGAIVIITFDEGSGNGNQVYCAMRGPGVHHGLRRSATFTHYGLIAGIEDHFGLPRLHEARAARAVPI